MACAIRTCILKKVHKLDEKRQQQGRICQAGKGHKKSRATSWIRLGGVSGIRGGLVTREIRHNMQNLYNNVKKYFSCVKKIG